MPPSDRRGAISQQKELRRQFESFPPLSLLRTLSETGSFSSVGSVSAVSQLRFQCSLLAITKVSFGLVMDINRHSASMDGCKQKKVLKATILEVEISERGDRRALEREILLSDSPRECQLKPPRRIWISQYRRWEMTSVAGFFVSRLIVKEMYRYFIRCMCVCGP